MNTVAIRVKTHGTKKVNKALLDELISIDLADFLCIFTGKQQNRLLCEYLEHNFLDFSVLVARYSDEAFLKNTQ